MSGTDPERHYRGRGRSLSASIVHCPSPHEDCPHLCKFLIHYINYGYQNIGFLKLNKIVVLCHTFFFLNLKFFLENLGFGRGNFPYSSTPLGSTSAGADGQHRLIGRKLEVPPLFCVAFWNI